MEKLYAVRKKQDQVLTVAQIMHSCFVVVVVVVVLFFIFFLFFTKFRLKLKKVGKTTRPFRYDLSQIPYHYTVKHRFEGLDLIDKVPDQWTEVRDIVQETGTKTIPVETKCKKAKWLPEEALQIAVKKR